MKYWTDEQRIALMQAKDLDEVRRLQEQGKFPPQKFDSLRRTRTYLAGYYKKNGHLPIRRRISGIQTNLSPEKQLEYEREIRKQREEDSGDRKTISAAIKRIEELEFEREEVLKARRTPQEYVIHPKTPSMDEAVVVIVASDWHVEEVVTPEQVNSLNRHDDKVAKARIERFFQNSLRLVNIAKRDSTINTIVLALLGDFLSGYIHEGFKKTNTKHPGEAIWFAESLIISGIKFLLKNTDCDFIIPCHHGNHARTTQKNEFSTEQGESWEVFMYKNIQQYFEREKRLKFIIAEGYHTYLTIFNTVIRFHHGHAIKYAGGVGGITIPVNKAIAQWNKGRRADLDVFGHYHQLIFAPYFVCNGSTVGYNAFALSIKAEYEPPRQAFFLITKKHGRTLMAPILVENGEVRNG